MFFESHLQSTLIEFYRNTEMLDYLNQNLYKGTRWNGFGCSWDDKLYFQKDKLKINIRYDDFYMLFGGHIIKIYIEGIKVYGNGWEHKVPKEMISYIKNNLSEIKQFNIQCKENCLVKSYKQHKKAKELESKNKAIKNHEEEKQRLINIFKNKEDKIGTN